MRTLHSPGQKAVDLARRMLTLCKEEGDNRVYAAAIITLVLDLKEEGLASPGMVQTIIDKLQKHALQ